jgi:hypothetical protein
MSCRCCAMCSAHCPCGTLSLWTLRSGYCRLCASALRRGLVTIATLVRLALLCDARPCVSADWPEVSVTTVSASTAGSAASCRWLNHAKPLLVSSVLQGLNDTSYRWLKHGNNLSGMRPWLYRLADEDDEYTQTLFCPDLRIQTVLAVEKASKIPLPRGDAAYPTLNEMLQSAWGARITPTVSFVSEPLSGPVGGRRSHSGRARSRRRSQSREVSGTSNNALIGGHAGGAEGGRGRRLATGLEPDGAVGSEVAQWPLLQEPLITVCADRTLGRAAMRAVVL